MKALTGLDAAFLALETPEAPMLIGGLGILDPRTPDGRLDFERFREILRSRLPRTVAFRRRLASVPLELARPYWVEIAPGEVDLEHHLERTELPEPGGWHELSELVAHEMGRPLDRRRPLWQSVWVEGLRSVPGVPEGSVALLTRIHHAAIDGVSGAEILAALFDGVAPAAPPVELGEEEPGVLEVLARTGRDVASLPLSVPRSLGRSLLGLAGGAVARLRSSTAPPLPFAAPVTLLNQPVSARRSWSPAFFGLDRVKAVKGAVEGTVNDVVLAVCAGALSSWLAERDALPEEPLVAMVPVSVRRENESGAAGNRVSAMLVSLATDVDDPLERLLSIRDAARSSKSALGAVGAENLVRSAELLPFALSGAAVRAYSRLHLAGRHRPPFNLVITNVPGPPSQLTVGGATLLSHVGSAPVFDGLGLILPVFSYAGTMSIGVTADHRIVPDAADLAARIEASLEELEAAVN